MRKIWRMGLLLISAIYMIGCGRENSDNSIEDNNPKVIAESEPEVTEAVTESEPEVTEAVTESEPDVAEAVTESEPDTIEAVTESKVVATKAEPSVVYMTREISPEAIIRIYEALGREAKGKVAVKVHMGEPGGENYLKPDLVKDFVLKVNGTFVDCNTAYGGRRTSTEAHMQVAEDHGFTAYTEVDILDSEGSVSLPIKNGKHLTEDLVGSHYKDYDFYVILSHFKGHAMGGFGGAIKNMSIGFATPQGKNMIHTVGKGDTNFWLLGGYDQEEFLESMAEAAKAIVDNAGENILYISIMNNLSVDCDCDAGPADPVLADIGILASLDPVALDKACVDQIYAADEKDSATLRSRIESRHGMHTLDYAEELGVGSQKYELVMIDE